MTTLSHVSGTLTTKSNSPEIETETRSDAALHINVCILTAALHCSFVYVRRQWGHAKIKEVTLTYGSWKQR